MHRPVIDSRSRPWLVRTGGAILAFAIVTLADNLGLSEVIGGHMFKVRTLALVAGALLAPTRFGVLLWIPAGVLTVIFLLVAYTPIVHASALSYVRKDPSLGTPDAVIVLSGAITEDGRLKGQAIDRLLTGMEQARRRGIGVLALSGVTAQYGGRTISSEPDQSAVTAAFAPDLRVHFVRDVLSTRDEAMAFAALARTHRWQRVLVVTSPIHTRRACRTLEFAGLNVECFPAESREYSLGRLTASDARIQVFGDVVYEFFATILYRSRGWIQ